MFGMSALFLVIGVIYAVLGDTALAETMCVLAAMTGCFGLFYGILWFVYARKEQARQQKIERAAQILRQEDDHRIDYKEFVLPQQKLTEAAKMRFRKIALGLVVAVAVVFVVMSTAVLITCGYGGPGQLIVMAVFCMITGLPGVIMQYIIYRKYEKSVPGHIMFFPGKILVDEKQFLMNDIEKITVSSYKSNNPNNSALYRKLIIQTKKDKHEYTIDYRNLNGEGPHWKEYGVMLEALKTWAEQHRADLTVDYTN